MKRYRRCGHKIKLIILKARLNLLQEQKNIPWQEAAFMEFLGWNAFDPYIRQSLYSGVFLQGVHQDS
jgi:hypothetical protein